MSTHPELYEEAVRQEEAELASDIDAREQYLDQVSVNQIPTLGLIRILSKREDTPESIKSLCIAEYKKARSSNNA